MPKGAKDARRYLHFPQLVNLKPLLYGLTIAQGNTFGGL